MWSSIKQCFRFNRNKKYEELLQTARKCSKRSEGILICRLHRLIATLHQVLKGTGWTSLNFDTSYWLWISCSFQSIIAGITRKCISPPPFKLTFALSILSMLKFILLYYRLDDNWGRVGGILAIFKRKYPKKWDISSKKRSWPPLSNIQLLCYHKMSKTWIPPPFLPLCNFGSPLPLSNILNLTSTPTPPHL